MLRVNDGEKFPADMILLKAVGNSQNCCYIDTKNIDGEMNLERKNMVVDLKADGNKTDQEQVSVLSNQKI